jgi:hypothetical protein
MYQEPIPRTQEEVEADLAASNEEIVQRALVDGAHFLPCDWMQRAALRLLDDGRRGVQRAALVSLSILVRRCCLVDDGQFWVAIERASQDPELTDTVEDLLGDLETYR